MTSIKVENLSKLYRLGEIGTGTLSLDIERWWRMKILKQEDPYLKIGQTNDRTTKGGSDIVYALRDINFEVEQGDAVGIIGKNGAGKSTLLKILSRVTAPSTGKINIKGRIASLLEVGTGFHPELTGKENIYLNGAILGMRKKEIDRKLDEIIDFSGVERYIDTPVKRYSSGMYVRLAFAVAAHLESEILIVDEVLAVGDAEFQKKCLGKMGDISKGEGRTVLFVSHNMGAILNLCQTGILLTNGKVSKIGLSNEVVEEYLALSTKNISNTYTKRFGNKKAEFLDYRLSDEIGRPVNEFFMGEDIFVDLKVKFNEKITHADIGLNIKNYMDELITHVANFDDEFIIKSESGKEKWIRIRLHNIFFSPGTYSCEIALVSGTDHYDMIEGCLPFTLIEGKKIKRGNFPNHIKIYTQSKWNWND